MQENRNLSVLAGAGMRLDSFRNGAPFPSQDKNGQRPWVPPFGNSSVFQQHLVQIHIFAGFLAGSMGIGETALLALDPAGNGFRPSFID
jgi:hypothetical protein